MKVHDLQSVGSLTGTRRVCGRARTRNISCMPSRIHSAGATLPEGKSLAVCGRAPRRAPRRQRALRQVPRRQPAGGGGGGGAPAPPSRDSSVGAECGGGAIPSTERSSTSGAHDGGAVGHRAGATAPRGAPSAACAASAAREDSGAGGQCYGGSRACGEAGCGRQGGEAAGACDHPRAGSGVFAGVRAALDPRLPVDHVAMCAPALLNPRALCVAKTGSTRACVSAMVIALGLGTARAPLEPAPGAPLRPSLE